MKRIAWFIWLILLVPALCYGQGGIGMLNSEADGSPDSVYAFKTVWPNGTTSISGGVLTLTLTGISPTAVTVANEATDTSCYPLFVTGATGDLGPKTNANLFFDSSGGNVGLGGISAFGTSAAKVLGVGSGTAPSTSPADMAQLWVADVGGTAAKAAFHMRDEAGFTGPVGTGIMQVYTHGATEAAVQHQMYRSWHDVTGAYTVTLPQCTTALLGMSATFAATTAAVFTLDCNVADHFTLAGTDLTAGNTIDSDGTVGAQVEVVCSENTQWTVRHTVGVFIDGGAT